MVILRVLKNLSQKLKQSILYSLYKSLFVATWKNSATINARALQQENNGVMITYIVLYYSQKMMFRERDTCNVTITWLSTKDEQLEYNSDFDVKPKHSGYIGHCMQWWE
jgi:hypothetical protein